MDAFSLLIPIILDESLSRAPRPISGFIEQARSLSIQGRAVCLRKVQRFGDMGDIPAAGLTVRGAG